MLEVSEFLQHGIRSRSPAGMCAGEGGAGGADSRGREEEEGRGRGRRGGLRVSRYRARRHMTSQAAREE